MDIIIEYQDQGLVLIDRAQPLWGWGLPGGLGHYGETLEDAARREDREETGLEVTLLGQFHTYSDPQRAPRQHTITTVLVAQGHGTPGRRMTLVTWQFFSPPDLPTHLAFDHGLILGAYLKVRQTWLTDES